MSVDLDSPLHQPKPGSGVKKGRRPWSAASPATGKGKVEEGQVWGKQQHDIHPRHRVLGCPASQCRSFINHGYQQCNNPKSVAIAGLETSHDIIGGCPSDPGATPPRDSDVNHMSASR
ncbi:hypothetical protein QC762_0100900 [Podospora pseudocomata]|uniref:Uncharacterized protein n=1 Tax=Podospora pseudocomata TaxID=2093779 RepID=A0ABR0G955_9PEZI|nr:hypothetical protein QC762_0100900 [Podospora pseudocomata]